jgi:predicted regulator of Ras-like GTPase activity (Roadblock/LC7/MglB family)
VDIPKDAKQADPLREALEEYLSIPGMKAALLISDQGLMISSVAVEGFDTASIAALAIDTVATVQRFGMQVQAGYLDTMRIEFAKLTVVLAPFATDVMLALVAVAGSLGALSGSLTPGRRAAGVAGEPAPEASQAG